jgi:putative ABC transport system permease protein
MRRRNMDSPKPPRIAEWILGFLYSDQHAFTHLGDFEEVYERIRTRRGASIACLWYVSQILKSIPSFLLARFYWSVVMFRNYFIISLRTMIRDKGSSLINLGGLAAGMACFLLILTYVRFETSFDRFHHNVDRIYRVISSMTSTRQSFYTPDSLASVLRTEITGIERITQVYRPFGGKKVLQLGKNQFYQSGLYTDAAFLDVFSFPLVRGNRGTALSGPAKIVLTETVAKKLFGGDEPIGKTVVWKGLRDPRDLIVTAVLEDIPANSHLKFDYLISLDTLRSDKGFDYMFDNWRTANFSTYIELAGGRSQESAEAAISDLISRLSANNDENRPFQSFQLQPLADIHLKTNFDDDMADTGDLRYVRLFMAIAFLILLIACVNHVNLATARSAVRAREIGIRKVTGAHRTQVFQQLLGESFVVTALAGVFALGLVILVMPWFGTVAGIPMRVDIVSCAGLLPWLAATALFVGLCAGIYPAVLLSDLRPVRTLKEFSSSGRKNVFLRNLLVVSQFTASVVLIAATLIVSSQMNYVKSTRLGYNREHVVVITAYEQETSRKISAIKTQLEERSEVVKVSRTAGLPTDIRQHWSGWEAVKDDGTKIKCGFQLDYVDENFLDVFEIGLAAGRNFRASDKDVIILNEAALRDIGWEEPIGKKLTSGGVQDFEVVGIVKDFHFASLHSRIGPMALLFGKGNMLAVRIRQGDVFRTLEALRSVFEKNTHGQPFDFFFLDDAFDALYRKEMRTGEIFRAFTGLAVLIACLGLFGLTSFNVARRTKEIGIRKILGASVSRLVLLLNQDLVRLVIIGNLLAWPIAYFAMNKWLENFAYRISIRPWIFLLSSILSLVLALLVVGAKTVKAALVNPSETLRYE